MFSYVERRVARGLRRVGLVPIRPLVPSIFFYGYGDLLLFECLEAGCDIGLLCGVQGEGVEVLRSDFSYFGLARVRGLVGSSWRVL